MQFFDSHCHFDFTEFENDREAIWRSCHERGINYLIIPGVAPEQWVNAARIAEQNQDIYYSAGLHPWWIKNHEMIDPQWVSLQYQLEKNISLKKCIAIGECGLDVLVPTPLLLQQKILDIHLHIAQENSLPLILHCRNAHNELLQQIKNFNLTVGGVVHGFSGSYDMAMQYWSMGFRLGVGGTITYERANKTREAVKKLPLESMLLETDAPDMPLSGKQGERNNPINIIAVAQVLADLRGDTLEHIALQTTRNAQQLFKITD